MWLTSRPNRPGASTRVASRLSRLASCDISLLLLCLDVTSESLQRFDAEPPRLPRRGVAFYLASSRIGIHVVPLVQMRDCFVQRPEGGLYDFLCGGEPRLYSRQSFSGISESTSTSHRTM